jgi:phytoene dehydrogenase-like protein
MCDLGSTKLVLTLPWMTGERRSGGGGVWCVGGKEVPGGVGLGGEASGAARRLLRLVSSTRRKPSPN